MTSKEMIERVDAAHCAGQSATVSVSISGIFLCIGEDKSPITDVQAEILWTYMPILAGSLAT